MKKRMRLPPPPLVMMVGLQCAVVVFPVHFLSFLVLIDFSLTVKAATLIFISGRGLAISSTKQGKSGSIYNLVKN